MDNRIVIILVGTIITVIGLAFAFSGENNYTRDYLMHYGSYGSISNIINVLPNYISGSIIGIGGILIMLFGSKK